MKDFIKKITSDPPQAYALFIIFFVAVFIAAGLAVGFVWPLYLLAMGVSVALSVKYPQSGLLAMIALTMLFERFFTLQTVFLGKNEYKIYPVDIVMLGIMAGIGRQIIANGNLRIFWDKLKGKSAGALAAFMALNGVYFFVSVYFLGSDVAASFSTLKNYAFYSLLYFLSLWLINSKEDVEKIVRFFFLGALGIVVFVLIGIACGEGLWSEYTPLSTTGIRTLAFTHGLYLSLILIPALLYLACGPGESQNGGNRFRRGWYALAGVWMAGIAGTMMRHLWIALAISGAVTYFFLHLPQKKVARRMVGNFFLAGAAMGIVAFYAAALFPQSRLNTVGQEVTQAFSERIETLSSLSGDESYAWRSVVWHAAYERYKNSPFFGIGTGQRISVELGSYRDFVEVKNLHNSYLTLLIQLGVAGVGLFLFFIWTSLSDLIRHARKNTCEWYHLSILSILGVYLVAFIFQPYLETNLLSIFFWISLGVGKALVVMGKSDII